MVWNRRTDAKFHRISNGQTVDREQIHGHRLVPNDETDWITVKDTHPALISRRQFQLAKAINSMDWKATALDVRRFVRVVEQPSLDLWSNDLFLAQLEKLK